MRINTMSDLFKQLECLEERGARCEQSLTGEISITSDDAPYDRIELRPMDESGVQWRMTSPFWDQRESAGGVTLPVEAIPGVLRVLFLQRQKHLADRSELVELLGWDPQAEWRANQEEKSAAFLAQMNGNNN